MDIISFKSLKKTFRKGEKSALNGITATIPEKKVTGLIGCDGAGKTTLLRIIAGLLTLDGGSCLVFNKDIKEKSAEIQKDIGYLPQKLGLYEDLTVLQNLSLYTQLQNVSMESDHVTQLMKFSGLNPFKERLVGDLSGGMKQKLGLITALLRKPKLLLLDEPTIGLDPLFQNELWAMIFNLNCQGMTIVVSTSSLEEAEKCQNILLLNDGNVLFSGVPATFTEIVKGKTFFFENVGDIKRTILDELLGRQGIIDTIVEGDKIKVTFNTDNPIKELASYGLKKEALMYPRQARLEDAFIYKLGGVPKRAALKVMADKNYSASNEGPLIEAIHLTKSFGSFQAVSDVNFSIKKGEIFGLLGSNGAGKSTTFKMLCGLLPPTSGEALVSKISLREAPSLARSKIGYMAQKFSLYDNMTVMQNLRFFAGIYSVENSKKAIEEMVEIFDLKLSLHTLASALPLGFKQRLSLSCALMHKPKVLFLDEPTSGVDPLTRREFWHQINILAASGVSILVSTHLMDEAEFCDRIAIIYKGIVRAIETPEALKKQVKNGDLSASLFDAFCFFCKEGD
jgi:ABC-2 type transport system ATP-binding protein